jgi:predicted RNA methylase
MPFASGHEGAEVIEKRFSSVATSGTGPLQQLVDVLFRRRTDRKRRAIVESWLREHGMAGKTVLDLACGSGEIAFFAAEMGARVAGLDRVGAKVASARRQARERGLEAVTTFHRADVTRIPLPPSDVTLVIGVCEHYPDVRPFLARACEATSELLVVVDARGPWWRRLLRHLLGRLEGFDIHYRSPDELRAIVEAAGFVEALRVRGHSFWALAFRRGESGMAACIDSRPA